MEEHLNQQPEGQQFHTTQWSVVLTANHDDAELAHEALEKLCAAYWNPLYSFLRRKGISVHSAQDLVQGFFERLLSKQGLRTVEQDRGKFRTFLLKSLTNYMLNEWKKDQAIKRGGGMSWLSFDEKELEDQVSYGDQDQSVTPEIMFDRQWAQTIVDRVHRQLKSEYEKIGLSDRYKSLKKYLLQDIREEGFYADQAAALGLSESGLRTAMMRFRKRFAELFRNEIGETVADKNAVAEEVRYLVSILHS